MRLHISKYTLFLLFLAFSITYPQAMAQENTDTLCVCLPEGTTVGSNPDPWLSEGYLLDLTGDSWTFHVRVIQMDDTYVSYKTHLIVALNDAAYNNLIALTVNGTTLPKASFRNGTPTPFNEWTWPNDVYPTWFNDTYIDLGTIYAEEPVDLTVSATFSDTANVRIHFDAYGKAVPCTIIPDPDEISWSPSSHDSTVVAAPKNPVASFNFAPEPAILNEPVLFDASDSYDPDGWIVNYEWNFGDDNTAATTNPTVTHTYLAIGNYTVTLLVTDNDMNTALTSAIISVVEYPTARFTYSPETPLVGQNVTFDATLSTPNGGNLVSYTWNFGGGAPTAVESDPITHHIYTEAETVNVTLTVVDSEGLSDTTYKIVQVALGYPTAIFSHSPKLPTAGELVTFDASASTPNGGDIISYEWDFGDDNTATTTDPIINHQYLNAGTYNVTLSVEDSEGLTDATWKTLSVRAYPYASFTYSPSAPRVDETVTFDASASEPDGGIIVWYYWDFGEGNTANETDSYTSHEYNVAGTYNVTLTIADSENLTDITWKTLTVEALEPPEPPRAFFTQTPLNPIVGQTVVFDAAFSEAGFDGVNLCPIVWYYWEFDDGTTANETHPTTTHTYSTAGTYDVTLTVYAPSTNGPPEYHPYDSTWHSTTVSVPVGGYAAPINKFSLITRWIVFASILILAIASTTILAKRRNKTATRHLTRE